MTRKPAVIALSATLLIALAATAAAEQKKKSTNTKKGGEQQYLTIKMNDALITSYKKSGDTKKAGATQSDITFTRKIDKSNP